MCQFFFSFLNPLVRYGSSLSYVGYAHIR
uniref:Uncharacterized protein n=1 Tax=Anguilla anguilla TaxID=7936 RepID=A0A0E9PTA4_ANGAN